MGALIPGIILVLCYALYVIVRAYLSPQMAPSQDAEIIEGRWKIMLTSLLPPFVLITSVLGSILLGIATPTEAAGVDVLTLGQYMRPTINHLPVERWYSPEEFQYMKKLALDIGFKEVASGPLVRSSYRADKIAHLIKD